MKRSLMLLLILFICLLESGCWNRRELGELGIVMATAIDMDKNNQWVASFQVVNPGAIATQAGSGNSQSPVTTFSTKGKTLRDAFQNVSMETPRALFLAHNRVVLINEDVAKRGVKQIIDFYLRDIESRETMKIILTKGNARGFLEILTPIEKISGNTISKVFEKEESNLSMIRSINMHEFVTALASSPLESAVLPEIKVSGEQRRQTALEALQKTRRHAAIQLGSIGVFRQAKLVGWLSQEESLGLAWISDAISHTVVTFPCDGTTYDQQLSSFFVEKGSTKLIPSLSNGKLGITVDVKAKGVLEESACKLNLQDPKVLTKLEHSIQDEIKKEIEVAFKGAKRLKTDVLGFGNAFHTEYPNAWKEMKDNWGESFMDIKMNVKVEANIRRTGIINNSVSKILK